MQILKELDDKYNNVTMIGQGTFGQVFKAEDRDTGKEVAIKLMKNVLSSELNAKYASREIKVMRHLSQNDSLYTTKLMDVIIPEEQQDSHIYIVQEHFGMDLESLIHRKEKYNLTEDHIRVIAYNMICAANYLHSGMIVHRDLKPSNVLINGNCNIKFCDMGLARSIIPESSRKMERPRTPRVGSKFYMAPEVILGNPKYDYGADIWGIGCILAELLLNFVESNDSCALTDSSDQESTKSGAHFSKEFLFHKDPSSNEITASKDQSFIDNLKVIFETLGSPDEKTAANLTNSDKDKKDYLKLILKSGSFKNCLDQRFQSTCPQLKSLLEDLLELDPSKRKTASELLDHKAFRAIRHPSQEVTLNRVSLSVDFVRHGEEDRLERKDFPK